MPAISIDTFFACSLMVLLVLSAMTATAKILQPLINASSNVDAAQRFDEIAKHMLLYTGKPADWGRNGQIIPEEFGLAEAGASDPYALDIDKVSRLNGENIYSLSYAQIFTSLKTSDLSFRIEIKPFFEVKITLAAVAGDWDETIYTFDVITEKDGGGRVSTVLKAYVVTETLLQAYTIQNIGGKTSFNITLPKSLKGPFLLVVLAKSAHNNRIVSYAVHSFTRLGEPATRSAFIRLSPLNYSLTVTLANAEVVLENVYALTFNHVWRLNQTGNNVFSIPASLDASPTVLVAFGLNATQQFVEWTAYPQVPLQIGVDFASLQGISDVYVHAHPVSISNGIYKCTVFLGGPKP